MAGVLATRHHEAWYRRRTSCAHKFYEKSLVRTHTLRRWRAGLALSSPPLPQDCRYKVRSVMQP
jgi:hypothetical protein